MNLVSHRKTQVSCPGSRWGPASTGVHLLLWKAPTCTSPVGPMAQFLAAQLCHACRGVCSVGLELWVCGIWSCSVVLPWAMARWAAVRVTAQCLCLQAGKEET